MVNVATLVRYSNYTLGDTQMCHVDHTQVVRKLTTKLVVISTVKVTTYMGQTTVYT